MKALFALTAAATLGAVPAYADCPYPPQPDKLPDGHTATMAEMVDGQKAVKAYDTAINNYLACIKVEHDDAVAKLPKPDPGKKPSADQQKKVDDIDRIEAQKHNAAIDQDQSVADRFNEQVRIFKARDDQKKK
jgi:hypothetical protein